MQKIIQTSQALWQRYAKGLKLVFVTSVVLFVIISLGNFFKTVNWDQVTTELTRQSWTTLVLLSLGASSPSCR